MCMGLHLDEAQWLLADQSFNAVFPKLTNGPELAFEVVQDGTIFGSERSSIILGPLESPGLHLAPASSPGRRSAQRRTGGYL